MITIPPFLEETISAQITKISLFAWVSGHSGLMVASSYVGSVGITDISEIANLTPVGFAVLFAGLVLAGLIILDKRLEKSVKDKEEIYKKLLHQLEKENSEKAERIKDLERLQNLHK